MGGGEGQRHQYGPPQGYQIPSSAPANTAQHMPPPPPAVESYTGYGFSDQQQYPTSALQGGAMQGVEMQYSPTYVQDPSRSQSLQQQAPQQQFASYANVMMPTTPAHNVYESMPQYQQRQSAAIEVLTDRFGNPSYLPSTGQGGVVPSQYMTSQPDQGTFQQQLQQPRMAAVQPEAQQSSAVTMSDQQYPEETQPTTSAAPDTLQDEQRQYQEQLKMTFRAIKSGKVNEASEKLTEISRWLLSSAAALGLHHDEPEQYAVRVEMWREFNLAWEALGLKQKDIFEEALRSGRQPPDILTADRLTAMVDELLGLIDRVETYGLVDYDMGIWEEQIVHIFIQCLDLFPPTQAAAQST